MPDRRARHTPPNPAYHEHGAPTRDRAHHTHPGPQPAADNEKGLQP